MTPAGSRDRWVALGLLLAVLALAYLLLVHAWWTVPMQAESRRIDSLQQRELRARMQLRQEPQVDQALESVRQQQSRTAGFLPESSAQLATAGLIKRLETVVEQASPGNSACMIQNRSPLTEASRERYARVAVQVRLKCGVPETAAVLHALESGTPRLFVDNLNVLAQRYFNLAGRAGQGSGGLDVTFDLVGYLRPAPGAAAPRQGADGAP